jgi:hypothetical protein
LRSLLALLFLSVSTWADGSYEASFGLHAAGNYGVGAQLKFERATPGSRFKSGAQLLESEAVTVDLFDQDRFELEKHREDLFGLGIFEILPLDRFRLDAFAGAGASILHVREGIPDTSAHPAVGQVIGYRWRASWSPSATGGLEVGFGRRRTMNVSMVLAGIAATDPLLYLGVLLKFGPL